MGKPDLILLHGALGSKSQFDSWIPHLENDFQIHLPELEGHGLTADRNRPFSMEHFVENLDEFIENHQLKDPFVFGYSMGGYVALFHHLSYPGKITSVFTLATKFAWSLEIALQETRHLDADKISAKIPDFAKTLEERHTAFGWRNVLKSTAEMMHDLGSNPRLNPDSFQRIQIPARITVGDKDRMVGLEETIDAFRNIEGCELEVFPSTPHPLEQVNVSQVATAMKRFFLP